tara:strand:- start:571 stop:846 length:276 start_codon:yes stop_codon:yes gene_type:complete
MKASLYPQYPPPLKEIEFGVVFVMLNYDEYCMRVHAGEHVRISFLDSPKKNKNFDDDGYHVPIVNLTTGRISWMAKNKPCKVVNNETIKSS